MLVISVLVTVSGLTEDNSTRTSRFLDHRRQWISDFARAAEPVDDSYRLLYVVNSGARIPDYNHQHDETLTVAVSYVELGVVSRSLADAVAAHTTCSARSSVP